MNRSMEAFQEASRETFRATCFSPLSPQGKSVPAAIDSSGLILFPGEAQERIIPFENLQISAGGFSHDEILLTWHQEDGAWSLIPADADSMKRLLSRLPEAFTPRLRRWRKKAGGVKRRLWAGGILFSLLILLPLFLAFGLWRQSDRIAGWVVDRISPQAEERFGDLVFEQTRLGLDLIPEGVVLDMVEEIGEKLAQDRPYPFKWHVADHPAVNAVAIPGGHVIVFSGLIRAAGSAEEVAGVLAHEMTHVTQRHSLKALVHNLGWQAVVSLALGEWGGGGPWDEFAAEIGLLQFSRSQELDADLKGLALLKKAEIHPKGMIAFFERLAGEEGASAAILSSHPASADRAAALRAEIDRLGPWKGKPLPYDWNKIKAALP